MLRISWLTCGRIERWRTVIVELYPWEYAWACHVGIERFTANWTKQDAMHYDRKRMEDDRTAQQAACLCELAVAKAVNRFWSGHYWHKSEHDQFRKVADVGTNIEVRRVRSSRGAAVRRRQLDQGLVLFAAEVVAPEFRSVDVWGWLTMETAWNNGEPSTYDPEGTRLVRRDYFQELINSDI